MYTITRVLGVAAVLVLLGGASLGEPLSSWVPSPPLAFVVRVVFLLAAVLVGRWVILRMAKGWRSADVPLAPRAPVPGVREVSSDEQQRDIIAAVDLVQERYSPAAIASFVRMLTNPRYRLRMTERAELLGSSVRTHVVTDYVMSSADRQRLAEPGRCASIPVPLLNMTKGEMSDNLDVTDEGGNALSLLSQREATGLVVLALDTLFFLTFERAPENSSIGRQQEIALLTLKRIVSRIGRLTSVDSHGRHWGDKLRDDFRATVKDLAPNRVDAFTQLEDFCWFFAANDVLVVDVPAPKGNRFIVKYSKTNALSSRTVNRKELRVRLGLVPQLFHLPLNLAFEAESYHFRMDVGESQYVKDHYITRENGEYVNEKQLQTITNGGHVQVQNGTALPYAHLYARGLNKAKVRDLYTAVTFRETPPGALGATAVVAAVSAVLIAILTFVPPTGDGPNADTAALLLAVPLFATTLVGHSIERVQRSSLATYVGLAITGITAFAGGAIFGLVPGKTSVSNVNLFGLFVVPSVNVVGVILSIIGVANVIYLMAWHRYHSRTYLEMLSRRTCLDGPQNA